LPKYEYCRYRKILGNTGYTSIADTGRFWNILVIILEDTGILVFTSICTSIADTEDTGKILVLPVLCTSTVVPVSWPASIADTGRFWKILVIPVLQILED
jgi:hypothetical protein